MKPGAKRLNPRDLAALLSDPRHEVHVARIENVNGEAKHWRSEINNGVREIIVGAVTQPGGIELEAVLFASGGLWRVPALGSEVCVLVPGKELGYRPIVMAQSEAPSQSLDDDVTLLVGGRIRIIAPLIELGEEPSGALATLADVQNLRNYVASHFHPASSGTTSAPTTPPASPIGTQTVVAE